MGEGSVRGRGLGFCKGGRGRGFCKGGRGHQAMRSSPAVRALLFSAFHCFPVFMEVGRTPARPLDPRPLHTGP